MRSLIRNSTLYLNIASICLLAAACSNHSKGEGEAPLAIGTIPSVISIDQVTRPIDPYVPTLAADKELAKAEDAVTAKCMKSLGFAYNYKHELNDYESAATAYKRATPLYGYFGTDVASDLGYNRQEVIQQLPPQDANYLIALGGADSSGKAVNSLLGLAVPAGGCSKEGSTAVGGELPRPDQGDLPGGGPGIPTKDPRIARANEAWSACMKEKGFNYTDPVSAYLDNRWGQGSAPGTITHTPAEVATAAADLNCKKTTNLVGIASAVQAATDEAYIASHREALASFQQKITDRLHKAETIVSSEPNG